MPIYEFRCERCGMVVEFILPVGSGTAPEPCGQCGLALERVVISTTGRPIFRGRGFHETDYGR